MNDKIEYGDNKSLLNIACGVQNCIQNGDRYEIKVSFPELGNARKKLLNVLAQGKSYDIRTTSESVQIMTISSGPKFENLSVISVGINSIDQNKLRNVAEKEFRKSLGDPSPII